MPTKEKLLDFPAEVLEPILQLSIVCNQQSVPFYLIGAMARDILFQRAGLKPRRLTQDLDFAIAIKTWNNFEKLADSLGQQGFNRSKNSHRFRFKNTLPVDIVPFGEIADQNQQIAWPPDQTFVMSVLGFSEGYEMAESIVFKNSVTIKVANLEGLLALKLISWGDRHEQRDAEDIGLILSFLYMLDDRLEEKLYKDHQDLINVEHPSLSNALAGVIGRVLLERCEERTRKKLISILEKESQEGIESPLLKGMVKQSESEEKTVEEYIQMLRALLNGLKNLSSKES